MRRLELTSSQRIRRGVMGHVRHLDSPNRRRRSPGRITRRLSRKRQATQRGPGGLLVAGLLMVLLVCAQQKGLKCRVKYAL